MVTKGLKIFIVAFVIFIFLMLGQYVVAKTIAKAPIPPVEKIITSNPIDFNYIASFSKYRSCQGHDFSGYHKDGVFETNRSMKHYINPKDEYVGTKNVIPIYAPYDGEIVYEFNEGRGSQIWIKSPNSEWIFYFFHADLAEGFEIGSKVTSGQKVGYGNIEDAGNFDMAMEYIGNFTIFETLTGKLIKFGFPPFSRIYASPTEFFSDEVVNEYENNGIQIAEMVHSREFRESNPCDFNNEVKFFRDDHTYLDGNTPPNIGL